MFGLIPIIELPIRTAYPVTHFRFEVQDNGYSQLIRRWLTRFVSPMTRRVVASAIRWKSTPGYRHPSCGSLHERFSAIAKPGTGAWHRQIATIEVVEGWLSPREKRGVVACAITSADLPCL